MPERVFNTVVSAVDMAAGLAADDTTLTVVDGSGFAGTGDFRLICGDELMKCTGVSSNDLTVTRGEEGSVATAHENGAEVRSLLTAAGLAQYVSEQVAPVTVHRCQVFMSTYETIPNDTDTALNFDTESLDVGGMVDLATHPTRITVPFGGGGHYLVWGTASIDGGGGNTRRIMVRKGGSTVVLAAHSAQYSVYTLTLCGMVYLAAGNYIELLIRHNTGNGMPTAVYGGVQPSFGCVRVG